MQLATALELLRDDAAIVVHGRTFEPQGVREVTLETGEKVYWAEGKDGTLLSLAPESDEILLFEEMAETPEPEDDMVVCGGEDYELSYEGTAVVREGESNISYALKDFEGPDGNILRLREEEMSGETAAMFGTPLTEEDLQEA